jgi:hypothetical protein
LCDITWWLGACEIDLLQSAVRACPKQGALHCSGA